jgi:hypothetical protein
MGFGCCGRKVCNCPAGPQGKDGKDGKDGVDGGVIAETTFAGTSTDGSVTITPSGTAGHTPDFKVNFPADVLTALQQPTLVGNTLTIPFLNENGVVQSVSVNLAGIVTNDINVQGAIYNASTNIITITETDGSTHTIDLSEFSIVATTNPDGSITVVQEGVTKFTIPAPCCVDVIKTPLTVVIDPNVVQTTNLNSIVTDSAENVFYIDANGVVQPLSSTPLPPVLVPSSDRVLVQKTDGTNEYIDNPACLEVLGEVSGKWGKRKLEILQSESLGGNVAQNYYTAGTTNPVPTSPTGSLVNMLDKTPKTLSIVNPYNCPLQISGVINYQVGFFDIIGSPPASPMLPLNKSFGFFHGPYLVVSGINITGGTGKISRSLAAGGECFYSKTDTFGGARDENWHYLTSNTIGFDVTLNPGATLNIPYRFVISRFYVEGVPAGTNYGALLSAQTTYHIHKL